MPVPLWFSFRDVCSQPQRLAPLIQLTSEESAASFPASGVPSFWQLRKQGGETTMANIEWFSPEAKSSKGISSSTDRAWSGEQKTFIFTGGLILAGVLALGCSRNS